MAREKQYAAETQAFACRAKNRILRPIRGLYPFTRLHPMCLMIQTMRPACLGLEEPGNIYTRINEPNH